MLEILKQPLFPLFLRQTPFFCLHSFFSLEDVFMQIRTVTWTEARRWVNKKKASWRPVINCTLSPFIWCLQQFSIGFFLIFSTIVRSALSQSKFLPRKSNKFNLNSKYFFSPRKIIFQKNGFRHKIKLIFQFNYKIGNFLCPGGVIFLWKKKNWIYISVWNSTYSNINE